MWQIIVNPYIIPIIAIMLIYAIVVAIWLILENRSPQSTFAWLFLLLVFPLLGILVYWFFGRGRYAFSSEGKLMAQALDIDNETTLASMRASQREAIAELEVKLPLVYQKKLLNLVLNNTNSFLTEYNNLDILQNADEKYPRLTKDIAAAKQSIHMAYYIWEEDEFTHQLKDQLIQKAQAGCEVRVLVDAQGIAVSNSYLKAMRAGGVQMYTYYNYRAPLKLHTISYRNHRKIVIIDGHIGYMGGLNLSQEHLDGGKYFNSWRDTHLRLEGGAARILQGTFLTSWYNTVGEKLQPLNYLPPLPKDNNINYLPIQISTSGPDSQWHAIRQLYFLMITAAEKHLYIQSPFFIPDESISEALKAAALAGVEVKLMFAPRGTSYSIPYWAANTYFVDMVQAGVEVYLYQKGYFHPKTVNVDSQVCSIGTANMDIRSFHINYEVNAIIYDRNVAQKLADDFSQDLEHCTQFTLAEYEARSLTLRLRDSLSRLASPLL